MKKLPESFGIMRDADNPKTEFKAMKFRVENPEHSRQIQERLFEMGYGWLIGKKKVGYTNKTCLSTTSKGLIEWGCNINKNSINDRSETTISDISPWQPKQGEVIEVRDSNKQQWHNKEFLCMDGDLFIVKLEQYCYAWYSYARPHNPHSEEIERLKARLKELEGNVVY